MGKASNLSWGQFRYADDDKSLTNVLSGQAIRLRQQASKALVFEYGDGEVEIAVVVQEKVWGWHVDFGDLVEAQENHGVWRRLAFFLPDSLAFWFCVARTPSALPNLLTFQGGWQNGTWNPSSLITCNTGGAPPDPKSPLNPLTPVKPLELPSLNLQPGIWRFLDAEKIVAETRLATIPSGKIPILDQVRPIERQLATSPRFVREDGGAVIFLRYVSVNFHRGEDYDPEPHYGYVNASVGFTFTADRNYGVWNCAEPVLSSPTVVEGDHFDRAGDPVRQEWTELSLNLREELLFALFDVCLIRSKSGRDWPTIRERDPERLEEYRQRSPREAHLWKGISFGRNLETMNGMPMRSPLYLAKTSFSGTSWTAQVG